MVTIRKGKDMVGVSPVGRQDFNPRPIPSPDRNPGRGVQLFYGHFLDSFALYWQYFQRLCW